MFLIKEQLSNLKVVVRRNTWSSLQNPIVYPKDASVKTTNDAKKEAGSYKSGMFRHKILAGVGLRAAEVPIKKIFSNKKGAKLTISIPAIIELKAEELRDLRLKGPSGAVIVGVNIGGGKRAKLKQHLKLRTDSTKV